MLIAWIGAMNIMSLPVKSVPLSRTILNAMNIYVLGECTHAVMDNVFDGTFEWRFKDSRKQNLTVSRSAI
jgi:hypothetical protein